MEIPGALSRVKLSVNESKLLATYLDKLCPGICTKYLYFLFKDKFLMFFDMFAGKHIKIPSRNSILTLVTYVKIYVYLKNRHFTEESYKKASLVYNKKLSTIKSIVTKIDKQLEKGENNG